MKALTPKQKPVYNHLVEMFAEGVVEQFMVRNDEWHVQCEGIANVFDEDGVRAWSDSVGRPVKAAKKRVGKPELLKFVKTLIADDMLPASVVTEAKRLVKDA